MKINKQLENLAIKLRIDVLSMLNAAGSGHAAGPLSAADVFTYLFFEYFKQTPKTFTQKDRDYFLLSNGHICTIWYACLSRLGFIERNELKDFRKYGSRLQGHPWNLKTPGVYNSSGMLGHGQGQAIGTALGLKLDGFKNNVICFMSDGEQDEGAVWEAAMAAPKFKLDNLTFVIDKNNIQIDGHTWDIMPLDNPKTPTDELAQRYRDFMWDVYEIDGHDFDEIRAAFIKPHRKGVPKMIISNTIAGKGVPAMEDNPAYHDWRSDPPLIVKAINDLRSKLDNVKE